MEGDGEQKGRRPGNEAGDKVQAISDRGRGGAPDHRDPELSKHQRDDEEGHAEGVASMPGTESGWIQFPERGVDHQLHQPDEHEYSDIE